MPKRIKKKTGRDAVKQKRHLAKGTFHSSPGGGGGRGKEYHQRAAGTTTTSTTVSTTTTLPASTTTTTSTGTTTSTTSTSTTTTTITTTTSTTTSISTTTTTTSTTTSTTSTSTTTITSSTTTSTTSTGTTTTSTSTSTTTSTTVTTTTTAAPTATSSTTTTTTSTSTTTTTIAPTTTTTTTVSTTTSTTSTSTTTTTTTVSTTTTTAGPPSSPAHYVFNAGNSGPGGRWAQPEWFYDNDADYQTSFARYSGNGGTAAYLNFTGNDCSGTDLGKITKVELEIKQAQVPGNTSITMFPKYGGVSNGDSINLLSAGNGTHAFDITDDTNAPGTGNWTWADIVNLDVRFDVNGFGTYNYYGYFLRVIVTFTQQTTTTTTSTTVSTTTTTTTTQTTSTSTSTSTTTTSTSTTTTTTSTITTTTTIPVEWVSILDNTDWERYSGDPYGNWDGSKWVSQEEPNVWLIRLQELGTWVNNYRPDYMRLTISQSDLYLVRLYDKDGAYVYSSLSGTWYTYASGDIVPLSFTTFDIDRLYLSNDESEPQYNLTNIEFGFAGGVPTTTTSTSTTTSTTSTTTTTVPATTTTTTTTSTSTTTTTTQTTTSTTSTSTTTTTTVPATTSTTSTTTSTTSTTTTTVPATTSTTTTVTTTTTQTTSTSTSTTTTTTSTVTTSTTIPLEWESLFFNNTKWIPTDAEGGTWNAGNGEWDTYYDGDIVYELDLTELGNWVDGFRPTHIRITHNGDTGYLPRLRIFDQNDDMIHEGSNYTSLREDSIPFGSYDIKSIQLLNLGLPDYGPIEDIEFAGGTPGVSTTTTSTTTSTTTTVPATTTTTTTSTSTSTTSTTTTTTTTTTSTSSTTVSTTSTTSTTATTTSTTTSTTVPFVPESIFNNTKWENDGGYGTWDGDKWVSEDIGDVYAVDISAINNWQLGYRPNRMRLTFTGPNPLYVRLYHVGVEYIYVSSGFTYNSGDIVPLNYYDGNDILSLLITNEFGEAQYNLTDIEFSGDDPATTTTTSTTTTTTTVSTTTSTTQTTSTTTTTTVSTTTTTTETVTTTTAPNQMYDMRIFDIRDSGNTAFEITNIEFNVPGVGWTTRQDTQWWINNFGTWDGSNWDSENSGSEHLVILTVNGAWPFKLRPSQMRITYTGGSGSGNMTVLWKDDDLDTRNTWNPYVSGTAETMDFNS